MAAVTSTQEPLRRNPSQQTFPELLRQKVEDEGSLEISWQPGGDGIIVNDPSKVKTYCKSFTHTMYDWGFKKGFSPLTKANHAEASKNDQNETRKNKEYWYHRKGLFIREDALRLQKSMQYKKADTDTKMPAKSRPNDTKTTRKPGVCRGPPSRASLCREKLESTTKSKKVTRIPITGGGGTRKVDPEVQRLCLQKLADDIAKKPHAAPKEDPYESSEKPSPADVDESHTSQTDSQDTKKTESTSSDSSETSSDQKQSPSQSRQRGNEHDAKKELVSAAGDSPESQGCKRQRTCAAKEHQKGDKLGSLCVQEWKDKMSVYIGQEMSVDSSPMQGVDDENDALRFLMDEVSPLQAVEEREEINSLAEFLEVIARCSDNTYHNSRCALPDRSC